jgi:hypothetical protein
MARKTLLTEAEIRQFMKLANITPLQEMGMKPLPVGNADDDERKGDDDLAERDGKKKKTMREEEEDEDPPAMKPVREQEDEEMEMDAPEGGEEMEMDAEMGEEPAGDMEMNMDMGGDDMGADMGMEGGKEEQFADVVEKLAALLDLDADIEIGGDEEMGGEAMGDEGGDLEGAMDAPEGDDEDPMMELADDELNEDDIVQEVARRVAARLLREKKQEDMANKLAERIFRRLASK